MAIAGAHMSDVFDARSTVAAEFVQDFNANWLANTLWVIAVAGAHMSDVFEARSAEAAELV